MSARAILPFLCAAALTLAPVPGFARVGVVVGLAPPAPVVEVVPAPPAPGSMSGSRATGAGTASSMSGCQAYMSRLLTLTLYGCPEAGSGTAAIGCGLLATGGTGGGEIGRAAPRPPQDTAPVHN